jgi:DUF1365 family protein
VSTASAIYSGSVSHTRLMPARHSFRYRVFSLLLDLDEIDAFAKKSWLFAHNARAIVSFHDKDHCDGRPLREWADAALAKAGIAAGGPIRLLCYPRLWNYVFNPLSVWFCYRSDGILAATIYEVHNTFGECHAYVLRADANAAALRQECAKDFYVSPFLSMDCNYSFFIQPPCETVLIAICETERGAPVLNATFSGVRQTLSDRLLALALLHHPLMTLKIVAAIHYEAFRLWLKRVPHHAHLKPSAPSGP